MKEYFWSYEKDEKETLMKVLDLLEVEIIDDDVMKSGNGEFLLNLRPGDEKRIKDICKIVL